MPRDVCKMILQRVRDSQYDEAWERAIPEAERLELDQVWHGVTPEASAPAAGGLCNVM